MEARAMCCARRLNSHDLKIGQRLKAARRHFGLTQKQIGEAIGVSVGQIGNIEHGRSQLSAAQIVTLARRLGISSDMLMHWPLALLSLSCWDDLACACVEIICG